MLLFIFIIAISAALQAIAREITGCSCGFEDDRTSSVYTDSIVLYFNETSTIDPTIFQVEDFSHTKEQGWNSRYKIGARPDNARLSNITMHGSSQQALEMVLDPADEDHLVDGASLRSTRRDIQYGLFEAAMRPARQWTGGTVLSYGLHFNRSDSAGFDFMNSNEPSDAQISNLVNGEWPAPDLVTNFTTMESASLDPWNAFTEVRLSWNDSTVVFDVAGNMTRLITKENRTLPTAGQALQINTWSTGDKTYGKGPPMDNATQSHVLWVRAFFNSSEMTESQHAAFDLRCATAPRCDTADTTLRGNTPYSSASELRWKEPPKNKAIRTLAGVTAACCSSFGIFALMNVFLRRTPWRKIWPRPIGIVEVSANSDPITKKNKGNSVESMLEDNATTSGVQTPLPLYGAQTPSTGSHTPAPSYRATALYLHHTVSLDSLAMTDASFQNPRSDKPQTDLHHIPAFRTRSEGGGLKKAIQKIPEMSHSQSSDTEDLESAKIDESTEEADVITPIPPLLTIVDATSAHDPALPGRNHGRLVQTLADPVDGIKSIAPAAIAPIGPDIQPPKPVDYLSGLTTVACIGVTLHHFCQTFWPFIIEGYGSITHYPKVEHWTYIFVGGILLSNLWIGPFFLTATRFLSTNCLKHGNLEDIARKELRRAPRLFVPIIIVSLLQYFLISMGLTSSLQWLPSVTYSSWPYVVAHPNFAVYINNIGELAYQIPNAAPEITSHYCIGVLWTIPVQLQYTYVVLAATVVMRDIRHPWKRFGIYALVIVAGWYAISWSACHWTGLVLSDLETTYHWRQYLQARPYARYAVLVAASFCAAGATLFGIFNQQWSFTTAENSIHPDQTTGKPIMAEGAVYPDYFEPTLAILLFSIGLQTVVELSSWVQAFLSLRFFVFLNPMIFCIYLTHGFVMWTWGAWVCLACNTAGMPYWANLIVTLVTTYVLILLLALVLTPLLEFPTQALMRNIERWTKEEPRPKRPTTAPFSKDLVLNRKSKESAAGEA